MLKIRLWPFRSHRSRPPIVLVATLVASLAAVVPAAAARPAVARPASGAIALAVDVTEAPRHLFHVRETIPAAAGPLTLVYPKWIPGEHGPTGPIVDVVGMRFSAAGRTIAWKRDVADMYLVHLEVPGDAGGSVKAELDFMTPADTSGFTSGSSAT